MRGTYSCPACGESEALRGTPAGDDIAVTCESCDATWMRGAPRCKTCGGDDIVPRPQAMARNPRGNQLAFVGWREVPLCRLCDAEVLTAYLTTNQPIPEGYVSACLVGPKDRVPETPVAPRRARPARAGRTSTKATASEPGPPQKPLSPARKPAPGKATEPLTVRQAIEAFLKSGASDADATAMLMLGTHLGSSNRLTTLEGAAAAAALQAWFERTWGSRGGRGADTARRAVTAAVDHWREQGWLGDDFAAELR
jgi:hypothetical protein